MIQVGAPGERHSQHPAAKSLRAGFVAGLVDDVGAAGRLIWRDASAAGRNRDRVRAGTSRAGNGEARGDEVAQIVERARHFELARRRRVGHRVEREAAEIAALAGLVNVRRLANAPGRGFTFRPFRVVDESLINGERDGGENACDDDDDGEFDEREAAWWISHRCGHFRLDGGCFGEWGRVAQQQNVYGLDFC